MVITTLPFDVLDEILVHLSAKDFLSLTSTCKQFRVTLYDDSGYWKRATIDAFRVRNRPSTENDGILWRKLYRRLQTQTKIFMWGQASTDGNPEQIDLGENGEVNPGIISDLQCGGWCTAFLNNHGDIFFKGRMDGDAFNPRGINLTFAKLNFPDDASPQSTAIRQFSAGRKHILGVADDGTTWMWYGAAPPAKKIEYSDGDMSETTKLRVTRVVAGWSRSAVYIRGQGIATWNFESPFTVDGRENEAFTNNDQRFVPRSRFQAKKKAETRTAFGDKPLAPKAPPVDAEIDQDPGEVVNFILLEHFVLFCTDQGQLLLHKPGTEVSLNLPVQNYVTDVQGSFRSFAIFTREGAVITAQQDTLEEFWDAYEESGEDFHGQPQFELIPALQNTGVIQVAFGDYHFHALHSDGKITSYGQDPGGCGALGLGRLSRRTSTRGLVQTSQWNQNAQLLDSAAQRGRAIWLLDDQRAWSDYVSSYLDEQPDITDADLGDLSQWMEDAGSNWENDLKENEDHLGPFFSMSVAAGGWRGGALVLVNNDLVQAIKRKIEAKITSGSVDSDLYARGDASKWRYLLDATAHGLPNVDLSRGGKLVASDRPSADWRTNPLL